MVAETTRRREIEAGASALFRERGYAGTSVRDIARALDIQGASLYAHVASKEDVLWSIVDRMATRFEAAADAVGVRRRRAAPIRPRSSARLVRAHVGVVTEDIERASVFVHEWRSLDAGATRRDRRADATPTRPGSGRSSRTASRPARFAAVDPTAAAAFILTALNGLVAWYRPAGRLAAGGSPTPTPTCPPRGRGRERRSMTDPLALDPILGPRERSRPAFNDRLPHDERYARSRRMSPAAARSSRPTGCPTSTGPPSCASSRCTPTGS